MSKAIPYTPSVLKWARESMNMQKDEVARRIKKTIELIDAWERGEASPTYVQLEKLAYKIYKRPIAIFFFPEPPEEEPLEQTFRTLPAYEIKRMPSRIVYLLRKAKVLQLNLIELYGTNYHTDRNILRDCDLEIHQDFNIITEQIRSCIGISLKEQTQWKDADKQTRERERQQ